MTEAECIEKLPFYGDLTADEKRFALRSSAIRRAEKGALIYSRGSCACVGMVLVLSGVVRTYLLSPEGREITLFRLSAGEPCVLTASCVVRQITVETHMVAEEDSELLILNAEAFQALCESNIHVRCFLYECATESFSSVVRTMEEILFSSFDRRLASFLVSESERTGSLDIRLTQAGIAEQVNSAREVVTRMLREFAESGAVELKRGLVRITDLAALKRIVE